MRMWGHTRFTVTVTDSRMARPITGRIQSFESTTMSTMHLFLTFTPSYIKRMKMLSLQVSTDSSDIDADVVAETLTYEAVNKPDWMSVSSSGVITGTPSNDDVGSHSVTVKVTDTGGASDTKTFSLTVNNTNDAPVIDVGDTTGALADAIDGSSFSHQLSVTDVDVGDSHTFSMSSDKDISWLSLDAETGLLTGTPDDEQVGVYNITFSVEDAAGVASVSDAISLTVQNINDPVYIADGQTSLFRSETDNQYTVLITDEDLADSYTFTATGLPTWMSLMLLLGF